jgi:hypothetical protein
MIFSDSQKQELFDEIKRIFAKGKKVDLKEYRQQRSTIQNAYQHGVIYTIFAFSLGWRILEAKQYFKDLFLSYYKDGCKFTKETSKLDTKETEIYHEQCRRHAQLEHNIYIPLPNEISDELRFEIDNMEKWVK